MNMKKTKLPRILGCDPGKRNFAVSVVELHGTVPVVLDAGMIEMPFDSLKVGFRNEQDAFLEEVEDWFNKWSPSCIAAERFQARGTTGGNTGELVSFALGLLSLRYRHVPMLLTHAAGWKNPFNKAHDEQDQLDKLYKWCMTPEHMLDASLIGCYGLSKGANVVLDYDVREFICNLEEVSREELINRKARKQS